MVDKQIDEFVSENRAELKHIDSEQVEVSTRRDTNLSFTRNKITVSLSLDIYTRPLGNELISAHPNGTTHGSGYGESGDERGQWELATHTTQTEQFTISGRNALRDALSGEESGKVSRIGIGQGTGAAQTTDDTLEDERAKSSTWGLNPQANQMQTKGVFLATQHQGSVTEFGVFSTDGNLIGRITTDELTPTLEEELRVDISMTFEGSGTGSSEITTIGEEVIADSVRTSGENVGIAEIVFGSGDSPATKSDTGLDEKEVGKPATRENEPEQVTAHAYLFKSEPETQPVNISEMGVTDANDRLLWRTTLREFEKNDGFQIESFVGFRFR